MAGRSRVTLFAVSIASVTAAAGWLLSPSTAGTGVSKSVAAKPAPEAVGITPATLTPIPASLESPAPIATPLDQVELVRQSVRRGGLGSQALGTFVIRNNNDYPVKNLQIVCAFNSPDGLLNTQRRRVLPETVKGRASARVSQVLVGFVNARASQANCTLASASRA